LSIDPVVTDANTGTSFNRYTYANNSPYKYIDPDGRFGVVGALIGAGVEAALQIGTSGHITSTKSILVAAGVGAVTGGLGSVIGKAAVSGTVTAGRAVLAATAVGGGAGAVGKVVDGAANGKPASAGEVAVAVAAGAVGGGIGAKIGLSAVAAVEDWLHAQELRAMLGKQLRQRRSVQLILVHPTRKRKSIRSGYDFPHGAGLRRKNGF